MTDGAADLEVLARDLSKAPEKTRILARQAVRKAARDVKSHAQRLAPVDTGFLRSDIHTRAETELSSVVESLASYAVYQEYGTRYQPGTPHMRPAAEAVEPGFITAIEQIGEATL